MTKMPEISRDAQRTLTQEEVDKRTAEHDRDTLTPAERLAQFGY